MKPTLISFALASALAASSLACSAGSTTPTPTPTPSTTPAGDGAAASADGANVDTTDAGGACVDLAVGAPVLAITNVATDVPIAQGGTFAPGTYDLTAWLVHNGPGGAEGPGGKKEAMVVRLGAGNVVEVAQSDTSSTKIATASGTYATVGTDVVNTYACPAQAQAATYPYTANPSEFRIYTGNAKNEELIFTRR